MESTSFQNVRFIPTNCYSPNHHFVKSWVFPYENANEELTAIKEANLADALARVGEANGLSNNDIHQMFPLIMRMLKSNSEWAK